MFSSFSAPFDLGKPVRAFGLDPTNRPTFYLDAGLTKSYSGSGTTWTDIAPGGGNDGTLTNSPTFSTDRFAFDGSNDHVAMPSGFADFTANFTNLNLTTTYATTVTLVMIQGATARIASAVQIGGASQTINWQGGSAPTGTNNGIDVITFSILNNSGTYTVLGQLVDF